MAFLPPALPSAALGSAGPLAAMPPSLSGEIPLSPSPGWDDSLWVWPSWVCLLQRVARGL